MGVDMRVASQALLSNSHVTPVPHTEASKIQKSPWVQISQDAKSLASTGTGISTSVRHLVSQRELSRLVSLGRCETALHPGSPSE